MAEIRTRHLFNLSLPAGELQLVGDAPGGNRRIGLIAGGAFEGERMRGKVLPGGADWIVARNDGTMALDVRMALETDGNAVIAMTYRGMRHGQKDTMARLARGEPVDPSEYYLRAVGSFETGAKEYEWLNRVFFIGTGRRTAEGAMYDIYELL